MKNLLLILLLSSNLILGYHVAKQKSWSENVAVPYMQVLDANIKCLTYVLLENRLPIIERVIGMKPKLKGDEALDTTVCDKSEDSWEKYETKSGKYRRWFK